MHVCSWHLCRFIYPLNWPEARLHHLSKYYHHPCVWWCEGQTIPPSAVNIGILGARACPCTEETKLRYTYCCLQAKWALLEVTAAVHFRDKPLKSRHVHGSCPNRASSTRRANRYDNIFPESAFLWVEDSAYTRYSKDIVRNTATPT